ncbi:MAG: SUMF1/EgtB/PvdO family nonheme iron enzyme [Bacteroidales bacterium]|nr:SUMF1/EgtB/PvdO family nonheme iron enzyme [Bacteroidales bacterium]
MRNKKTVWFTLGGFVLGFALMIFLNSFYVKSSSNESCMSCHVHTQADSLWTLSMHYRNQSGTVTDCAACHLPAGTPSQHFMAKARMGTKDLFSYIFKNKSKINWEAKRELDYARKIVFNSSCEKCHADLFPEGITDDALISHIYYEDHKKDYDLQCINCHLDAGHFNPNYQHGHSLAANDEGMPDIEPYTEAATVTAFENFTETVPGTVCAINMIAIPGGTFEMGSPDKEPLRNADEGPVRKVTVSDFFMAEVEVTWTQYWSFFMETQSPGRTAPEKIYANNTRTDIDAVSGPTPPYGAPDQGWGKGDRPAITMTHYGAEVFCQWLSLKTGRKYRLPTEAEWEYAARGGTSSPYYFEGSPKKFTDGFLRSADTTVIASNVIYAGNSRNRTALPESVKANPFGLKNMLGNVLEYCSDWYAEDAYSQMADGAIDPTGPASGSEYVVRGGNYLSDAAGVRCAARAHTQHDDWLRTDPQVPKSIWWYSDIKGIGFRVVCEVPEEIKQ